MVSNEVVLDYLLYIYPKNELRNVDDEISLILDFSEFVQMMNTQELLHQ
jgi:hypothetical protein